MTKHILTTINKLFAVVFICILSIGIANAVGIVLENHGDANVTFNNAGSSCAKQSPYGAVHLNAKTSRLVDIRSDPFCGLKVFRCPGDISPYNNYACNQIQIIDDEGNQVCLLMTYIDHESRHIATLSSSHQCEVSGSGNGTIIKIY